MTENKRFIYAKSEGGVGYAIYDTTKTYTFPNLLREYEAKVFCKILNELYEENEELYKRIDELVEVTGLGIDDIIYKYTEDI